MSMVTPNPAPVVPTLLGGATWPTHFRQYTDVTSFTYRTGMTHMALVEGLRHYIQDILTPHINENFEGMEAAWAEQINTLLAAVDAFIAAESASNAQAIADALAAIANADIIITDPAIMAVLNKQDSATLAKLNDLFTVTATRILGVLNAPDSPLTQWLDGRYVNEPDADQKVADNVNVGGSATRNALDKLYMSDDAARMNGKQLWTFGDSFTQPIYAQTPWPVDLAADRSMTLNNKGVSSSMMRDTAMRMIRDRSSVVGSDFAVINCGINAAVRYNTDGKIRASEMAALQTAILLLASDTVIQADATSNIVNPANSFGTYPTSAFSAGGGASTDQAGRSITWPNLPFGGYFGIGFTFRVGAGGQNDIKGSTGKWTIGGTTVLEARNDQPSPTALEINSDPQSSLNYVPWPAMFPVVGPGQAIKVESVTAGDITAVDAIYHVKQGPPTIVVILPTRVTASSGYAVSDDTLRVVRGDALRAIAELTQKYTQLRGRVYAVNPDDFGWDANVHTVDDGLHPNNLGHHLLATAVQRTVGRGDMIGAFMSAFGTAGPGVSYPVVWPTY